ncbi:MAG: hypothetical protein M3Z66_13420 [Chloroflexota bacterium]|nr:hypothetical protein [Chloroflexota bacterium]
MDRTMSEEQEDKAKGGDIGIGDGDVAGTNIPNHGPWEGAGTPEGGTDTGISGVTRTSAPPGETGGYGEDVSPGGLTGGYGTGGVTPEEQAEEDENERGR